MFIKPEQIIAQLDLKKGQTVADLGCGSGYYSLSAAKAVGKTGQVYSLDVQENKLIATQSAAQQKGYLNLTTIRADFEKPFDQLGEMSCDAVILANIIHEVSDKGALFENANKLLKPKGKLLAVEWKKDITPIGPDANQRVGKSEVISSLQGMGYTVEREIQTDGYHYALVFIK